MLPPVGVPVLPAQISTAANFRPHPTTATSLSFAADDLPTKSPETALTIASLISGQSEHSLETYQLAALSIPLEVI